MKTENNTTETDNNQVWYDYGNLYRLKERAAMYTHLENCVYTIHQDMFGFYLVKEHDSFTFDYKLYGLEQNLIDRVVKTYTNKTTGNLGVILNGLKGTGKTVSAKIIANNLNQPVILIAKPLKEIQNCHLFINDIPQNVTIFIDEYEKIFGQSSDMLTIMDGALNSDFRRVFLMTTNDLLVDKNLIERPSRVRYLKKFSDLAPKIVEEIIDDILINKAHKPACIRFISSLETITVDIVKAVLEEVNLHNESPDVFADVFNVKKLTGKYNIKVEMGDGEYMTLVKGAKVNYRPPFAERCIGEWLSINDEYVGTINEIINFNTIEIEPLEIEKDEDDANDSKTPVVDDRLIKTPMVIRIENADMENYNWTYGYGSTEAKREKKAPIPPKELTKLSNVLSGKKVAHDSDDDDDF